jgi:membrane protein DedA with SNARE-associated domain
MQLGDDLLALLPLTPGLVAYLMLAGAALIEYVFPPFPGDLIVVFSAFLVVRRGWPALPVYGAVVAGSALGLMLVYAAGGWLARSEARWRRPWMVRLRPRIDALVARFERHGTLYILVNRFLPSVRAMFFLAAGMARLPWWRVLLAGVASAAAWNAALFLVGRTVGTSWERLKSVAETYSLVLWSLLAVAAMAWLFRRWLRRRRATT